MKSPAEKTSLAFMCSVNNCWKKHLIVSSVEVNLSFLEDILLVLEIVSEPGNVFLLLLHSQVWISGQTDHHELHEVTHWPLTGKPLAQVFLKEDVLMERDTVLLLQA